MAASHFVLIVEIKAIMDDLRGHRGPQVIILQLEEPLVGLRERPTRRRLRRIEPLPILEARQTVEA